MCCCLLLTHSSHREASFDLSWRAIIVCLSAAACRPGRACLEPFELLFLLFVKIESVIDFCLPVSSSVADVVEDDLVLLLLFSRWVIKRSLASSKSFIETSKSVLTCLDIVEVVALDINKLDLEVEFSPNKDFH